MLCNVEHRAVGILGITVAIVDSHTAAPQPTRISSSVNDSEFLIERLPGSNALNEVFADPLLIIGMNQIAKKHLPRHEIFGRVAGNNGVVLVTEGRCELSIKAEGIYGTGNVFNQT